MGTEPEKPREEAPAPSRNVRLAWWWGIYIGIIVIWLIGTAINHHDGGVLFGLVWFTIIVPTGLGSALSFPAAWLADRYWSIGPAIEIWITLVLFPVSYVIFATHYRLTQNAMTRRVFLLLMLSLIFLTSASVIGFVKEMANVFRM